MGIIKPCPFCGGSVDIAILDDEFNIHGEDYEESPYSGLQYGLVHEERHNNRCPIATGQGELLGVWSYDSREEAIEAWNRRGER